MDCCNWLGRFCRCIHWIFHSRVATVTITLPLPPSPSSSSIQGAGHDLDTWLGRRLGATLVDARLTEGLSHFNAAPKSRTATNVSVNGGGAATAPNIVPSTSVNTDAATTSSYGLGSLGWRILRGLLRGDPTQRLTVNQVTCVRGKVLLL